MIEITKLDIITTYTRLVHPNYGIMYIWPNVVLAQHTGNYHPGIEIKEDDDRGDVFVRADIPLFTVGSVTYVV